MQLIFEPAAPLAPGEDETVAKAVEAGVFAAELIRLNGASLLLSRVVEEGQRAERRLWTIGLRIAHQQALIVAKAYDLPYDDLFQDCCIAVAEAIRRFDYLRRVRYTTFVFDHVRWTLANGSTHRAGASVSRQDRTAARKVARIQDALARDGIVVGIDAAARLAGVSSSAAERATRHVVSLDDVPLTDLAAEVQLAAVERVSHEFLELLAPHDRRVLEVRYGLNGERPHTIVEAAAVLRTSPATVSRRERRALAEAREVLAADRTTAAAARAATAVA